MINSFALIQKVQARLAAVLEDIIKTSPVRGVDKPVIPKPHPTSVSLFVRSTLSFSRRVQPLALVVTSESMALQLC